MVNITWHRKVYTNGWTDLNVGGKLLMKKDGQASLRHHKQMTIMLKRMIKGNRGITFSEIALTVGFSCGSAFDITTENFLHTWHQKACEPLQKLG
jgi:hypothetical protein